jgi:aspartyl-tRNA(Asn)/glutamyl-tRNA(Gln) amidotransferase subunit A
MMDAVALASAIRSGQTTAMAAVAEALDRAAAAQDLGAFISLDPDFARTAAQGIDAAIQDGDSVGPLAGVPIAIKDNIAQADRPCTCASAVLASYVAPFNATAVDRLLAAGAVPIGRTNMDEFGMGSSGEHSSIGPTANPWDPTRVPGGSSSGSAAAVAAGIVPIALGSDTGGSVRQPAALCGVVGLKPTYGRVSRFGLVAFGSSVDQIGPITASVRDAALALSVMAGADPRDATTLTSVATDFGTATEQPVAGMRIGLPRQCWQTPVETTDVVRAALEGLAPMDVRLVDVDIPTLEAAIPTYYLLTSAEASSNLARFDGIRYGQRAAADTLDQLYERTRSTFFGPEVQRRILLGTFALSAGYAEDYYERADAVRTQMRLEMSRALETVDALAMPTTPTVAFPLGEKQDDPVAMYLSDVFTTPPSLTGLPAISVPAGRVQGLPVGLQLVGAHGDEATVLRIAAAVETWRGPLRG